MRTPHATRLCSPALLAGLLAAALALACASGPPPLDPQLAAIAARAQAMDADLSAYERVEARRQGGGERSAFATYFDGREPVMIDESARTARGASVRRAYYYEGGRLFYVREDDATSGEASGTGEQAQLQLFFEKGKLVGSREVVGGKLVPVSGSQVTALVDHAAALLEAAKVARGPAHKIELDLAKFDDLGLVGPPLRAVRYAFCIPSGDRYTEEVRSIDPTIEVGSDSAGPPPCSASEQRCVGSTHQPAFRRVLRQLAELPYVERIVETASR